MEGTLCSVCEKRFDFQCSGVSEVGYRKLGDRKSTWKCLKCKVNPSPVPSPSAISPQPLQLDAIQEQLNKMMFQLKPLSSLMEDIKMIRSEITSMKDSLEMAYQLIGTHSEKVKDLESRVITAEKSVHEVSALKTEIARLNRDLEERDQWARSNNIEIRGIPQKNSENLYEIADKIGQICDFRLNKQDINYIARIPTRVPNTEKPIVISLNNRYTKEELVAASRKKKNNLKLTNLGFNSADSFFVNDHLTQRNKTLLNKARTLAKEKNFQYIWVKHCKIMARKSDTSPIFFIKSENDISKIT